MQVPATADGRAAPEVLRPALRPRGHAWGGWLAELGLAEGAGAEAVRAAYDRDARIKFGLTVAAEDASGQVDTSFNGIVRVGTDSFGGVGGP